MDKLRSHAKVKIHVENENLIMYGNSTESAGCVLRGIMNLQLQETSKIKSIGLELTGKMTISWTEGVGNGHERLFREEKTILKHDWKFLPKQQKMYILNAGSYNYEFEMILPGDIPESTYVANFYTVQYQLKAIIERSTFLPNISTRKLIHVSRQLLPFTAEFLEPISVANQWASKLDYDISLPTKIYTHGDQIPVTIRITPLVHSLKVRHLTCTLKEYMICKNTAVQGFLNTRSRTQGRVLFSVRDDKFGAANNANLGGHFVEWSKLQTIPLPISPQELQCDIQNESIRIKHKIKFVLSLMNSDGHISELRASLPVIICAVNNTGLPAYGETWRTLPYHPEAMLALLYQQTTDTRYSLPSYNSICDLEDQQQQQQQQQSQSSTNNNNVPLPPTYDEIIPWLVSN